MTEELVIRQLQTEDIAELADIEAKSFSTPWKAADFEGVLTRDYCLYLVALLDGRVVGSAGMTMSYGEGYIDNVVVAEDVRGRGIAGRLIEELLKAGGEKGIEAFTLEVRVSNAPAIRVYERARFVSEGIRPRFYEWPVEDAMIMWRR